MKHRTRFLVALGAVAGAWLAVSVLSSRSPSRPSAPERPSARSSESAHEPEVPPSPAVVSSSPAPAPAPRAAADAPSAPLEDEEQLMQSLRDSMTDDPEGTILRAHEAEARFPESPHAPERAWLIVRSLVNQSRFHEARTEAQAMVARYPHNSWALDVERHLLVYPLDQPSREAQQAAVP